MAESIPSQLRRPPQLARTHQNRGFGARLGRPSTTYRALVHDRMSAMPRYSCTFLVALLAAAAATVRAVTYNYTWIDGAGCKSCERCCPSLMPLGHSLTDPDFSCGGGPCDADWMATCLLNACPERTLALADLPDELLDPAAMGEWIPYDEYNGFPLRSDSTCTDDSCPKGTFVLWKDWYKGTVNALHQTAQTDAEWQKLVDAGQTGNRQEGGTLAWWTAAKNQRVSACSQDSWTYAFHTEDGYGRGDASCANVARRTYDTTTWKLKNMKYDITAVDGAGVSLGWSVDFTPTDRCTSTRATFLNSRPGVCGGGTRAW